MIGKIPASGSQMQKNVLKQVLNFSLYFPALLLQYFLGTSIYLEDELKEVTDFMEMIRRV